MISIHHWRLGHALSNVYSPHGDQCSYAPNTTRSVDMQDHAHAPSAPAETPHHANTARIRNTMTETTMDQVSRQVMHRARNKESSCSRRHKDMLIVPALYKCERPSMCSIISAALRLQHFHRHHHLNSIADREASQPKHM